MLPPASGFNSSGPPVFLGGEVRSWAKILTASQMGAVDRLTTRDCGLPSLLLMENAGLNLYQVLKSRFGERLGGAPPWFSAAKETTVGTVWSWPANWRAANLLRR